MTLFLTVVLAGFLFVGCAEPKAVDWSQLFPDKDGVVASDTDESVSDDIQTDETMPDEATDEVISDEAGDEVQPDETDTVEPEEDVIEPTDDTTEPLDDTTETEDDALVVDDETPDTVDADTVDIDMTETDTVDIDVVDVDTLDIDMADNDLADFDDDYEVDTPEADIIIPDSDDNMISIPAGQFMMGCNTSLDSNCANDEKPYHAVTLSGYKIDKHEVTAGEFAVCVADGACNNSGDRQYYENSENSSCNLNASNKGTHPVNCVTWYGAKAYCVWLGKRLPTEAEWEKAARGTEGQVYPWGNQTATCALANLSSCGSGTVPVESIEAGKSPYGIYESAGNVGEWVNDYYDSAYYETSPSNDPQGPASGTNRSLRGASWGSGAVNLRSSNRYTYLPTNYSVYDGFRCAKNN